jgi:glycogen synthase
MRKALAVFAEQDLLRHYQENGMAVDFSWDRTARQYETIYHG